MMTACENAGALTTVIEATRANKAAEAASEWRFFMACPVVVSLPELERTIRRDPSRFAPANV
jgi:hypothetical protein